MTKDALQELEVKVAFLEDALNTLSDEFYKQQKEMEKLKMSHTAISEKLNSSDADGGEQATQQDEVPPHY
jgi:SlyX protein